MDQGEILDYMKLKSTTIADGYQVTNVHVGKRDYKCVDEIQMIGLILVMNKEGEYAYFFYYGTSNKNFFRDEIRYLKRIKLEIIDYFWL